MQAGESFSGKVICSEVLAVAKFKSYEVPLHSVKSLSASLVIPSMQ
jgi:hypothetical protein